MKKRLFSGQAIVEVLVAMTVAVIAMVALLGVSRRSISSSGQAARDSQASAYAQEALQWVADQKAVLGWDKFLNYANWEGSGWPNQYCLATLSWSSGCASGNTIAGTGFYRELRMGWRDESAGANFVTVVTAQIWMSWNEGGRTKSITLTHEYPQR